MMWILAIVGVLMALFWYYMYIKPTKQMKWYKKVFEKAGYKTIILPYSMFAASIFVNTQKCAQAYGDSHFDIKNIFSNYDIVIENIVNIPVISIVNPSLIKQFYQPSADQKYHKISIFANNMMRIIGNGLSFKEGEDWKKRRKIMNFIFNYDFITQNISNFCDMIDKRLDEQDQKARRQWQEKGYYEVGLKGQLFSSLFSNIFLKCFFGYEDSSKIEGLTYSQLLSILNKDAMQLMMDPVALVLGQKFMDLGMRAKDRQINHRIKLSREHATKITMKKIQQFKQKDIQDIKQCHQIISALCFSFGINKDSKIQDLSFQINSIIDEVQTFNSAGADITGIFTEMMVYLIVKNPHVEQRLRKEISQVIKSDKDFTKQNLKKLVYIDWIQKQTTRFSGPGTGIVTRIALKDHYLGHIPILKGTGVQLNTMATHYCKKYYQDPFQFRPQRWQSQCDKNPAFSIGGFNGGAHSCIGKHFAMLETKITLIKFFKRYSRIQLAKNQFKMRIKFIYGPQEMKTKLYLSAS